MKILIAGATGFLGQAIADEFKAHGHTVYGLAHDEKTLEQSHAMSIEVVEADLTKTADLLEKTASFEAIILAASLPFEKELEAVRGFIEGSKDRAQQIIFTSGTGVLSIAAEQGQWNENSFAEDDPYDYPARPNRAIRIQTETLVRMAASGPLRTYVIRPPLIWGRAKSPQVERVIQSAKERGAAWYIGYGLNLYSNVNVDDLAQVYRLVIERGVPGALYHAVAGEANFRSIAEAVADMMGVQPKSVTYDEACELWSKQTVDIAHITNSRSRSPRTLKELGWKPSHLDLLDDIRHGSFAAHHAA